MSEVKTVLFERTMVPHLDAAYNLARWITRNEHDAEDVVQEAYLRAFRYFDSFTGGDGRAWLLTIVRNTCLNWLQGQRSPQVAFDEKVHTPAYRETAQHSAMVQMDRSAALQDCMDALPREYREALVMRELEELPYKSIAEVTALPIGTVMSRLSRGRKRLEDCLNSKGAML